VAPGDESHNGPTLGSAELQSLATHSTQKIKFIIIAAVILSINLHYQATNNKIITFVFVFIFIFLIVISITKKKKNPKNPGGRTYFREKAILSEKFGDFRRKHHMPVRFKKN